MKNVIKIKMTESFKDKDVFIPRIPLIPTDMAFQFKRLQFSILTRLESLSIKPKVNLCNYTVLICTGNDQQKILYIPQ